METQSNTSQESTTQAPNTTPITPVTEVHKEGGNNRTLMGILSYLGFIVLIPLLMKNDDPFIKFHIKQGLVLLTLEVILWVLGSLVFFWSFWPIYRIIHLALIILSIIGIINVVQNRQKELPLVGGLSKHFKI